MLGHSSIVLTADTYTSVLPDVAHAAAEKVASLVLAAGYLIPGTGAAGSGRPDRKGAGVTARRDCHEAIPAGRSAAPGPAAAPVRAEPGHNRPSVARQGLQSV
jgi:hypothetical protein